MRRHISVLGVPVDVVTEEDVVAFARNCIESGRRAHVVTVNVEYIMRSRTDAEFRRVLTRADLATPDSAGVVWAMRRQGAAVERRVGGSDLVWSLCEQAARCGHRVFLLGAAPGVADVAAERLRARFPSLAIAGAHSGSPADVDRGYIVDLIHQQKTDILFVAFGAPQQDRWIAENLHDSGARLAMGIGGSLDYVAGRTRRAPRWMRDRGLEWLWRLTMQPWRWRRMMVLPQFAWLIARSPRTSGTEERNIK
ncbi:MAG: WecB/TagA/CpsF family glycosyltransferase [Chloroflexota bacterium]